MTTMASDAGNIDVLIVGLGNCLLMDDGVGVHAVRELQRDPPRGAVVVEIGTAVLDALNLLASARSVVALDAVQAGGPPGTIYEMPLAAVRKRSPSTSLHEFDLCDACRLLPADCRPDVVVVGVEPQSIECGLELSPTVQAALPEFIEAVRRVVADTAQTQYPRTC